MKKSATGAGSLASASRQHLLHHECQLRGPVVVVGEHHQHIAGVREDPEFGGDPRGTAGVSEIRAPVSFVQGESVSVVPFTSPLRVRLLRTPQLQNIEAGHYKEYTENTAISGPLDTRSHRASETWFHHHLSSGARARTPGISVGTWRSPYT